MGKLIHSKDIGAALHELGLASDASTTSCGADIWHRVASLILSRHPGAVLGTPPGGWLTELVLAWSQVRESSWATKAQEKWEKRHA